MKKKDLSKYEWPKITKLDMAFSTLGTNKELLEEAVKRTPSKGIEKFRELFYSGGTVNFKKDVKGTWKEDAYLYARCLMSSWEPKHEHKELVVGMIFEEVLELN